MSPEITRRRALQSGVAAAVPFLAGCSSQAETASTTADSTSDSDTASMDATTPEISASEAESRALQAETEYVRQRLSNAECLDEWGIGEYTADAYGRVQNVTEEGFTVEVQRPFSWQHDGSIADGVGHARYVVSENQTRVRSHSDLSIPC